MIYILIIITLLYLILITSFCIAYDNVKEFKNKFINPKTRFSIVIPFRNEAEHLPALLNSISELNYPVDLFEIILVDDDSNDDSKSMIDNFINSIKTKISISIIENIRITNSPKKDAITLAINHAKYDWIVTTDADCILPKTWLKIYDSFIQKNKAIFIVAPLTYTQPSSFLDTFQLLDVLSLQTVTISGFGIKKPFLCNGANLAYTKKVFKDVEGFKGNGNISSGDDIFLLEKILVQDKNAVHYLKSKNAIVKTHPETKLKDLFYQRVRWAAKTSSYNNTFGKLVGFIVLLMNAILVIGFVLSCVGLFLFKHLVLVFIIKFTIDFWCIYKSASFFNQNKSLKGIFISSLLYPIFSVFVVIYSTFFEYTWKHRSFRK